MVSGIGGFLVVSLCYGWYFVVGLIVVGCDGMGISLVSGRCYSVMGSLGDDLVCYYLDGWYCIDYWFCC